jgi:hypothetical protein
VFDLSTADSGGTRYAIHLHLQRDQLSPDQFTAQVARVERHCDRLLQRSLDSPDARRLQRRYLKHRQKLSFFFIAPMLIPPTMSLNGLCVPRSFTEKLPAVFVPNGARRLLLPSLRSLTRLIYLAFVLLTPFNLSLAHLLCRYW